MSEAKKVQVKLVGAERYMHPAFGSDVIEKGQVVTVDADVAASLTEEVRMDALNNEHPVWKEYDDAEKAAEAKAAVKRTRTAPKKADDEDNA